MKKIALKIISTTLLFQSCSASKQNGKAPPLQIVSIIDRNGATETVSNTERLKQYRGVDFFSPQPYKKVLRIYKRDQKGNIPSYIHSYHENGQIKQYLEVVNSRANGFYREWFPNGALKLQVRVIGGEADLSQSAESSWLFDGISTVWNEQGRLIAEIPYEKGVQEGITYYYHETGSVWKEVPYKKGVVHGTTSIFLENGQIFQQTQFFRGEVHGNSKKYWGSNIPSTEEFYQNNRLISGKYYSKEGTLIAEIVKGNGYRAVFGKNQLAELREYRHGYPEGEVKIFATDQHPIRRFYVKNNQKHGEEIEYYDAPHLRKLPKLSISWFEDKIQGAAKTWYDNGIQESHRQLSNSQKNGISTAWYRDGNVMLIEEYHQDKLTKGEYFRRGEKRPVSEVKEGNGTATLFDSEGNFTHKVFYENGTPIGSN